MSGRNWRRKSCQHGVAGKGVWAAALGLSRGLPWGDAAYLVLGKGQIHIVVVAVVEHVHGVLSQLRHAVWAHGHGMVEPCQAQQREQQN